MTSSAFCSTSRFASPPPISLIVLFSAEGYSCLQGYENVRKAHSIFSYVNSHFPPEQTHFPESDLPRCTSHFPPTSLHYLNTMGVNVNSTPLLLMCNFELTDGCLYSSPFKQPRLRRGTLGRINLNETTLSPIVSSWLTINTHIRICVLNLFSF